MIFFIRWLKINLLIIFGYVMLLTIYYYVDSNKFLTKSIMEHIDFYMYLVYFSTILSVFGIVISLLIDSIFDILNKSKTYYNKSSTNIFKSQSNFNGAVVEGFKLQSDINKSQSDINKLQSDFNGECINLFEILFGVVKDLSQNVKVLDFSIIDLANKIIKKLKHKNKPLKSISRLNIIVYYVYCLFLYKHGIRIIKDDVPIKRPNSLLFVNLIRQIIETEDEKEVTTIHLIEINTELKKSLKKVKNIILEKPVTEEDLNNIDEIIEFVISDIGYRKTRLIELDITKRSRVWQSTEIHHVILDEDIIKEFEIRRSKDNV